MLDTADDARLQITAGVALLETSKLVTWHCEKERFESVSSNEFESGLTHFHRVFGRVICWIIFSAGAEFLAKGACLLRGVEIRKTLCVPAYPLQDDIPTWLDSFDLESPATLPTTKFGQIGDLYKKNGHLQSLFRNVGATMYEQTRLLAAYKLLGSTIRNRDAHAYVPRIRGSHFYLVPELFVPCLNDLVSWMQLPMGELNKWRREAQEFIDHLNLRDDQGLDSTKT